MFFGRTPEAVSFVDGVVSEAIKLSASDILFEPQVSDLRVRARIDGALYEFGKVGLDSYQSISSRIKVLAGLDPTEKRKIQEGQYTSEIEGRTVNLRVEITQTINGELIVIRIHEKETILMDLSQLGFSVTAYGNYNKMLSQRSGLILACGPTGCGKTTTLYSTITKLNQGHNLNVMTIENPVEFQLEAVNQMQTQDEIGFSFADGLRTTLRLTPDVVLVGEIRDKETAEIAVESGLTGQLVLSTLHADDSVGALFRLLDLGIETYFINSSLVGIVAQRLVRNICQGCKEEYKPDSKEIELFTQILGRPPKRVMKGKGCPACQNLAFKGRLGIFEVMVMTATVRDMLRKKVNEDVFRKGLMDAGFITLLKDGLDKVEQGLTTVEEVLTSSFRVF
ncbi:hypothetical protein A2962_04305 [Candidatus Woesebacteria bacterium RIFCSPLOWO2_01_FULL_39_61]|uniref:Bacterial type II secretion system protein E domain-containing protein n=1 Tax=Candidatus Woesebacteria bacterium RIFCSPHIGHO2_02_FULL_39_13 TaxID=1802505 RepID=A0A1F7YZS8_9BACT|nr:MAG: hypothetical protein A2692_05130 [Candidatus Woesebacteria bacterium RIFCSPHIGHO2_01_FULL_39_95]OGM32188.1 MAG: hypothetical protein A3D01_02245 [Candidatus Woesebacteria bacterium RIFCSPHIGHO2_02_FULL_39_13]OGM36542.1 MAG: hypothetical protein A3E13_04190 [Candidatus Woesebacteria bacterium RIFCSPHIGHO2_12_FULL_40_20]OGM65978.1 MAG: hypothetical protein A2962_04305 [Candidatus Woesebacteria bacterium RIFCSPLOWO2_01_FULL_39_61]OGM71985.1 MAG: hypothetical protein A3H19_00980 [Candidatus